MTQSTLTNLQSLLDARLKGKKLTKKDLRLKDELLLVASEYIQQTTNFTELVTACSQQSMEGQIATLTEAMSRTQNELLVTANHLSGSNAQLEQHQSKIESLESKLASLQTTITDQQTTIDLLHSQVSTLREQLSVSEMDKDELRNLCTVLRTENMQMDSVYKEQIDAIEKQHQKTMLDLQTKHQNLVTLLTKQFREEKAHLIKVNQQRAYAKANETIRQLEDQLEESKKRHRLLQTTYEKQLFETIGRHVNERNMMETKIKILQTSLSTLNHIADQDPVYRSKHIVADPGSSSEDENELEVDNLNQMLYSNESLNLDLRIEAVNNRKRKAINVLSNRQKKNKV